MKLSLSYATACYALVLVGIAAACNLRTNRSNQEEPAGELRTLSESLSPEGVESVTAHLFDGRWHTAGNRRGRPTDGSGL